MSNQTGPGRIEQSEHPSRIMLFDFDVDAGRLKPEHERALRLSVLPKLQNGGSVSIVGLASRTGAKKGVEDERYRCVLWRLIWGRRQ